ncbi:Putative phosphatase [Ignavibacterium album JCM 16511]|uniref:Putative phosphatase n=1 Tax=Ignavibacterium album (strain DSM 19864 / JCM 16511 / NBRC 101810 / Mat9-16) TaxID=945713 RepID=I0AFW7_IGNAJ|nr:macro domain-containing protein [Ignavibacterium album]AFH47874.1 Putative phosphatase [Ignavibacterium album JCM 16511]
MFRTEKENIINIKADALVNSVNLVGVMGKGVALAVKEAFPENYKLYKKACEEKRIDIGKIFVTETGRLFPRYIINFPTKKHWRNPSEYSWIEAGLVSLKEWLKTSGIKSLAIPPLGSGSGKLDWNRVKQMIISELKEFSNRIDIILIEPDFGFENAETLKVQKNNLTPARAMLLYLLNKYRVLGYEINLLVVQKIAYFLQRVGEPLKLNFQKGFYGPYAYNLIPVLKALKPKYLSFTSLDDSKPSTIIRLNQNVMDEVESYVNTNLTSLQKENLEKTISLIQDFETPFGLELLATIDFIFIQEKFKSNSDWILSEISKWTNRKANLFKSYHIQVAKERLLKSLSYN